LADALRYCIKKHASTLTTAPEDSDASQDESSSASSSSESEASDLDSEAGPLPEEDSNKDADSKAQRESQDGLAGFSGRAGLRAPANARRSRCPREGLSRLVIVIAAAESPDDVSTSLRRCFTHEVVLEPPDEGTRTRILSRSLGVDRADPSTAEGAADEMSRQQLLAALKVIALQTVGAVPRDLRAIAADAGVIAVSRRQNGSRAAQPSSGLLPGSENVPISTGEKAKGTGGLDAEVRVTSQDLETAFARAKTRTASAIGTPKVREFM
jgi:SpoVK/Ycf46/Vps4 family AAA+-type ATPase